MTASFQRVCYVDLNSRQKENFNFQKISGILADYGFSTIRLTDDWEGADFIAQHIDGTSFLKVQLKGRMHLSKKYQGKDLQVCFRDGEGWYVFPHDLVLAAVLSDSRIAETASWVEGGEYSFPRLSTKLRALLEPYKLAESETLLA